VTDLDSGTIKRKIGRFRKKKIEFYRHMLEAPKKDSEVLQLLEQKGAIADKERTAAFAERFADFSITRLTLANDFDNFAASQGMKALFSLIVINVDLFSFYDAIRGCERDQWLKAIFIKITELIKRGTFEFVNSSDMIIGHLIDGKWVLKRKYLNSGEIQKYKARIVARGFIQSEGVDYNETTASTARAAL
jgi:hypothetical protein